MSQVDRARALVVQAVLNGTDAQLKTATQILSTAVDLEKEWNSMDEDTKVEVRRQRAREASQVNDNESSMLVQGELI